jgi:uncharacterized protein (TIGR02996 family)
MTPEEAFLNDVSSWPIYADWLEEQDQPQRAALFRRLRFRNSLDMEFVLVPRGKFWMGGEGGKPGDREVTIPHDFYLGACTVTQQEWLKLMPSNPSWFSPEHRRLEEIRDVADAELAQFPVEQVSWVKAQEFLQKLNASEPENGWTYRLPTEAEWEYACRGAPISREDCSFDFYLDRPTNDLSSVQANFNGNHPGGKALKGPFLHRPTRVGSYRPNRLGLYDMHGNVWERCNDTHSGTQVRRGGAWSSDGSYCRASVWRMDGPAEQYFYVGFRVARVPVR